MLAKTRNTLIKSKEKSETWQQTSKKDIHLGKFIDRELHTIIIKVFSSLLLNFLQISVTM